MKVLSNFETKFSNRALSQNINNVFIISTSWMGCNNEGI